MLTRNFFTIEPNDLDGKGEINVVSTGGLKGVAKRIEENLRLEAIDLGESPQAFINDKLLSVGDKLLVRDGDNTYECEIVEIEGETVFVKYGGVKITLKLAQTSVVNY